MEEIFSAVYFEIKSSGYANTLNAGIVITGGGSQLKHLKQLVEYTTGLSARIGFPTSYVAKDNKDELKHPMYSTGIGLVLEGYKEFDDMKETQRREFFPELFETETVEVITTETTYVVETETVVTTETVETDTRHIEEIMEENQNRKQKNPIENMILRFKNWFDDGAVNGDFN
jgi:cell division ATPase FtsA